MRSSAPKYTNNIVVYGTFTIVIVVVVILLLMFLVFKPPAPKQVPEKPAPQILVIKESGGGSASGPGIPHYPSTLPKYNQPEYQQVGILTSSETEKEPIVLPLFGRKLYNRSDRWQYYTATDKNNLMRIPLSYENQECEDDIGCKEIYSGDKLSVSIYQDRVFTATIYKTQAPRYFSSSY